MMNLENTKVYTTDKEIIRKYGELCGVDFKGKDCQGNAICYSFKGGDSFYTSTYIDKHCKRKEITPEQINAIYAEKFGDKSIQLDAHLGIADSEEWRNGDECEHGHHNYSGANKMTYIGAHPFVSGKHVCLSELKGLVIVDSIWLRKPETPQQREEREQINAMTSDLWGKELSLDASELAKILYNLGYRKQSK